MEYIVAILIVFIIINSAIKLTFWKLLQAFLFSAVCAIFVIIVYPYAITQSKVQIMSYLNNVQVMQDITVLVTLESVLCLGFCFAALRAIYGRKPKKWVTVLYWYPGLLIFPALFYVLTNEMFLMPGVSFKTITYATATGIFLLIPVISLFIKWLLPERELRLEIHFLVSLFVAIVGLITTVNGNVVYEATQEPLNIKALIVALGLFAGLFIMGFLFNKYKWQFKRK